MTQEHPITPPIELIQQWDDEATNMFRPEYQLHLTARAAQWGADVQLKETLEYIKTNYQWADEDLEEVHDAMRPKPLTKQQKALLALDAAVADGRLAPEVVAVVREALV